MSKPVEPVDTPSVVRQLRLATRQAHRRLDHHPLLQQLVRDDVSRPDYAAALSALYVPHVQLERCVASGSAALGLNRGDDAPSPRRLDALGRDLDALGRSVPRVSRPAWPVAATPAALVGQRYVLDGSRLGGTFIAGRLATALGTTLPLAYFSACDAERHWARFLAFAERHCPPEGVDRAVAAAQAAFANYLAALDAED
ncbi:biliverdin-producing heme oxygenase [Halomonas campisalis]|uniref:Biliverdin-producing heme oxygenase n=1 Tax=Billgrantia campisalis TaxID=74661 RepID=A0ABS9P6T8_9GAMM|nr:biliverdin-producing heme oxygenase [Halomonas campisalis]MCG6656947.1 biliverdin-producing heme oxygenase [Halomonas campisalis]MDR5862135.1 biliverdin-producing heme oxygenase [Halomonas campisalis]